MPSERQSELLVQKTGRSIEKYCHLRRTNSMINRSKRHIYSVRVHEYAAHAIDYTYSD